jgi:hypothetical protein
LFVCYRQLVSGACTSTLWIDVGLRVVNNSDGAGFAKIQKAPLNIAGLQLMSFDFLHQRSSIEMKEFRSLVFDPFGFLERLQNQ